MSSAEIGPSLNTVNSSLLSIFITVDESSSEPHFISIILSTSFWNKAFITFTSLEGGDPLILAEVPVNGLFNFLISSRVKFYPHFHFKYYSAVHLGML